jgi:glycosyltransferase involved in cell wall biosynthesis
MIIHFDNIDPNSTTGPATFAMSLARGLYEAGHSVTFKATKADVSLVFIEPSGNKLCRRVVQRLDGIWFSPEEFNTKNLAIRHLYTRADAVVWQSEFDKKMTLKWFGQPKFGTVILNATDALPVREFSKDSIIKKIRESHELVFVSSASWHGQKRLEQNYELFNTLRWRLSKHCALIVLGNPDKVIRDPDVCFCGHQPLETCLEAYSAADWMIHLAWADHSPNTVVHALSQKTPVICSEVGGTCELVKDFGIILKDDQYDFELVDYDNPPLIDLTQVTTLPNKVTLGKPANVSIARAVSEYVKVFESVLRD